MSSFATIFCIFLFFAIIFFAIIFIERRNLYSGIFFILAGMSFGIFLLRVQAEVELPSIVYNLTFLLLMIALLIVVTGPFVVIFLFAYSGVFLLKREGLSPRNLLSLGVAFGLVVYIFGFPILRDKITDPNGWLMYVYVYIGLVILYFICLASTYTLSSILNIFNFPRRKLNYVVVLGAGLIGERVTPLLASRIRKGIKIYQKNKGSKLIMSGGQGPDEIVSEAFAMKNYALEQGVPEEDIIMEERSTTTEENIKFSHALMTEGATFALVTNYYHVFRALILARVQNVKCIGYGAATKFYFTANAFVREFIGYLYLKRKRHILILGLLTLLYFGFALYIYIYYKYYVDPEMFRG